MIEISIHMLDIIKRFSNDVFFGTENPENSNLLSTSGCKSSDRLPESTVIKAFRHNVTSAFKDQNGSVCAENKSLMRGNSKL